jgi:hypothetical protein
VEKKWEKERKKVGEPEQLSRTFWITAIRVNDTGIHASNITFKNSRAQLLWD